MSHTRRTQYQLNHTDSRNRHRDSESIRFFREHHPEIANIAVNINVEVQDENGFEKCLGGIMRCFEKGI